MVIGDENPVSDQYSPQVFPSMDRFSTMPPRQDGDVIISGKLDSCAALSPQNDDGIRICGKPGQ